MDDTIETADATEPTQTEVVKETQADLAQMFEPSSEQPEPTEQEPEVTEEVFIEEEEDVLLQSDEDEADEEMEAEDEGPKQPESKAVKKLLKQVSRLTAQYKGTKEELESLKGERQEQAVANNDLDGINDLEALEKYKATAVKAKQFAMQNLGKEYVEHNGEEYDSDRINALFQEADEALTVKIPERKKFIETRRNIKEQLPSYFPWLKDDESPIKDLYERGKGLPELKVIHGMANAEMIFGYLAEGVLAVEHKAQLAKKAKAPKKAQPPKAMAPNTAPRATKKKDRTSILGNGNIDIQTFSQFLDNKEEN